MESEKVKEIKKALECMSGLCKDSLTDICFNCEVDKKFDEESACKEALTLINELESENERLILQYERVKADSEMNCLELKDRIAELEKENGELKQHITEKLKEKILKTLEYCNSQGYDDLHFKEDKEYIANKICELIGENIND